MQHLENLPVELLMQPRFFPVGRDKTPHIQDWGNPNNQKLFCDIQQDKFAGFDTCGHGKAADYLLLDFDHVLDKNGNFVSPDAEKWFNYLATIETYSERSISGDGLHFILKPSPNKFPAFSAADRGTLYFDSAHTNDSPKLEIFYASKARYCFFTGNLYHCEPNTEIASDEVADEVFQHLIDELNKQNPQPVKKSKPSAQILSDSPDYDAFRAGIMLDVINPADLPDTDWLAAISAAKNLGIPYHVVDAWNKRDPKRYNERENLSRWNSLNDPSFDISTLHGKAKLYGYQEKSARKQWEELHTTISTQSELDKKIADWQKANGKIDPPFLSKLKSAALKFDNLQAISADFASDTSNQKFLGSFRFYSFFACVADSFFIRLKTAKADAKKKIAEFKKDNSLPEPSDDDSALAHFDLQDFTKQVNYYRNQAKKAHELFKKQAKADALNAQFEQEQERKKDETTKSQVPDCPIDLIIPLDCYFNNDGNSIIDYSGKFPKTFHASNNPIVPTKILRDPLTSLTQYEVAIKTDNFWRRVLVDGQSLFDPRRILILAASGALIESPVSLVKFFARIISKNNLPVINCYSKTGWTDDSFSSFVYPISNNSIVHRAGFNYEQEFASRGNAETWLKYFLDTCENGGAKARIFFGNALAAPLVRPFNISNIQVQIDGKSGSGKTALIKFAASIYGNPRKLIRTFGATLKNRQAVAAAYNDLPTFLDELETLQGGKKAEDSLPQMIYEYDLGIANQANKRDGTAREAFDFFGSRLMTGEHPILKSHNQRGAYKRLIQIHADQLFDDEFATNLHYISENHFGHFGRLWTKYVEEHLEEMRNVYIEFGKIFRQCPQNVEPTQLKAVTVDAVSLQFFLICAGKKDSFDDLAAARDIKEIISTLPSPADLDDSTRAIADLQSFFAGHVKYFAYNFKNDLVDGFTPMNSTAWECYGKRFDNGEVAFIPTALKKILENELGYQSADALIREFAQKDFLRYKKGRGFRYPTKINGQTIPAIRFKAGVFSDNEDGETTSPLED